MSIAPRRSPATMPEPIPNSTIKSDAYRTRLERHARALADERVDALAQGDRGAEVAVSADVSQCQYCAGSGSSR